MVKGLNACTDYATQPPGTFPRGSNLLLNKRGALDVCDGTQLIHAFNGQVQAGRGKMLCVFLFSPTGVSSYYLALAQALDLPLGPPQNLAAAAGGAGGTIPTNTYYYVVTALDGVGGETTVSNEVSLLVTLGQNVTLTWNIVPNAASYNVYRGTAPGAESLLIGTGLPQPQNSFGSLTDSFTDTGNDSSASLTASGTTYSTTGPVFGLYTTRIFITTTTNHNLSVGQLVNTSGFVHSFMNGSGFSVLSVVSPAVFSIGVVSGVNYFNGSTAGGTVTPANAPVADTTQQIVLFKMPIIVGNPAQLPVSYNNSNIIALFPALLTTFSAVGGGGGGSGGGGGTGGGGSGGGGKGIL